MLRTNQPFEVPGLELQLPKLAFSDRPSRAAAENKSAIRTYLINPEELALSLSKGAAESQSCPN
jgi:hypothetical protein